MKHNTKEELERRRVQRNARSQVPDILSIFPAKKPSIHPKGTVAHFADELSLPVELLIEQLEFSGISGLTPAHKIFESHKDQLLQYLRKAHDDRIKPSINSELLLEQNIIAPTRIELLEDINEELLSLISRTPELLYQLAPRKFEELIARLFADRGYEVSLTKATRDGGYDLLAKINDGIASTVVLAECKRYKKENKVGVEVVRGLYGVTEAHRANQGLIITSSYFTKDATEEQLRIGNRIGLRDFNNLVDWLKPYQQKGPGSN